LTAAGGAASVLSLFLSAGPAGWILVSSHVVIFGAAMSSEKMLMGQWVGVVLTTSDDILDERLRENACKVNVL
jgi:hypothetical protein